MFRLAWPIGMALSLIETDTRVSRLTNMSVTGVKEVIGWINLDVGGLADVRRGYLSLKWKLRGGKKVRY